MIGSVFIIDPLYTLWLAVGVVAAWRLREKPRAGFWLGLGLCVSSAYLGWTLFAQRHIERAIIADQRARGFTDARVLAVPTPFNSIAWRILVRRASGDYYQGWYSFAAPARSALLEFVPGRRELLEPLADQWGVQRLEWFTSGWIGAEEDGGRIVARDLRMGEEGAYVFRFVVGQRRDGRIVPSEAQALPWPEREMRNEFATLWRRIRTGG
jgi:inner membrane protein